MPSDALPTGLLRDLTHEFRNPLAGIMNAAEALQVVDADEERRALVGMILVEADRLERLIANLLDISRLDGGGLSPQLDWCAPEELVGGSLRECGHLLDNIEVTVVMEDTPALVRVDAVLVERILVNLIHNAVRHGAPPITITGTDAQERYRIAIDDRGPGVHPDVLPVVFEPFVHREGEGLGLGLPLCTRLAEAQGAHLTCEPPPGGGARFVLDMPTRAARR